ncbi:MAG: VOC family protein [SAR324 cluster bacterium]|nr:VOC family protein [SAR324 cluster bacterium]
MAVHSLRHYALNVPDLDEGMKFYTEFGLQARKTNGQIYLRCKGRETDQVILCQGPGKSLNHVAFGADADEIDAIRQRLAGSQGSLAEAPEGFSTEGLWLRDPCNALLHVQAYVKETPLPAEPIFDINSPGHLPRQDKRAMLPRKDCPPIRPRRLGHVLLFTPDVLQRRQFFADVLGFRISDYSEDILAFMHLPGGSEHHVIAFAKSEKAGFHHGSFQVGSPDEVGQGGDYMEENGYGKGWGFGRHTVGSNFFWYVRDPWNSYAEYYSDIDYIADSDQWEVANYSPKDGFYNWGPPPPDDFVKNYEE